MYGKLKTVKGEFVRSESGFRNWVTKDGSAGISGGSIPIKQHC
jgi:glutathionyl-hydroquinone reductase